MRFYLTILLIYWTSGLLAQCGSGTPVFTVNLSASPNATWVSTSVQRNDTCCGSTGNCIAFIVTLHPLAEGIIFDVCDGAIPTGAMFYQVACGPQSSVGQSLCLSGVGPHYITFCKPGNNINQYCITSVSEPIPGPNANVNDGCNAALWVEGYDSTTLVWNSIYPGSLGQYNSYLNCTTGCDSVIVTGQSNPPDTVMYEVCGNVFGDCDTASYCDTLMAYFHSELESVITPLLPTVCFGDSGTFIYANGQGGTPPYTYGWSTGSTMDSIFVNVGTYYLSVSDSSGCPPAVDTVIVTSFSATIEALAGDDTTVCVENLPFQLSGSILGASGGVWIGNGGSFSPDSLSLNANYTPSAGEISNGSSELFLLTTGNGTCPPDTDTLILSWHQYNTTPAFTLDDVSCFGGLDGQASVTSYTGTGIGQVTWATNPVQTGMTASGLAAGTYSLTVLDSLGCSDDFMVTIVEPALLQISNVAISNLLCFNDQTGSVNIQVTGGTTPYSFAWSNGATTANLANLSAGQYSITVTDDNGCVIDSAGIIIEPSQFAVTLSTQHVDCSGNSTGAITSSASGGVTPYMYLWSTSATTSSISALSAGTYTLTIEDDNGCEIVDTVIVLEPDSLLSALQKIDISCNGLTDGSMQCSPQGGVNPYAYLWSNSTTSSQISGLGAFTYTVTVTDDNGCTVSSSETIDEPLQLWLNGVVSNVTCFGLSNGSISTATSGGIANYTYLWSTGGTASTATNLSAGTYSATVTDNNGCTHDTTMSVDQPSLLDAQINTSHVDCYGGQNGTISSAVQGGTSPYFYVWSSGQFASGLSGLGAGAYTVTVTDYNGCTVTRTTIITEPTSIQVLMSQNQVICLDTSATISATASGGSGGYQYAWNQGLGDTSTHTVAPIQTTLYTVSVTDVNNCPGDMDGVTIVVKPIVFDSIHFQLSPSEICLGDTGEIFASYTGNASQYSFAWSHGLGQGLGSRYVSPTESTKYYITITDVCGFSSVDSVRLNVNPIPTLSIPDVWLAECVPFSHVFQSPVVSTGVSGYKWYLDGILVSESSSATIDFDSNGDFNLVLEVTSSVGCQSEGDSSGIVRCYPRPIADFSTSPSELTTDYPLMRATNLSKGAVDYAWTISDGAVYYTENIEHVFREYGDYFVNLRVESEFGCIDTAVLLITVKPVLRFEVPTAFTPASYASGGFYNEEALNNDVFYPISAYVQSMHMLVFNRWGEIVFESFDPKQGWDGFYRGKPALASMYVWKAEVVFVTGEQIIKTGNVSLLR